MGIVIRYLGKTIRENIEISKTHSRCGEQIIKDLERTLLVGSPNITNDSSTHENFLTYFR